MSFGDPMLARSLKIKNAVVPFTFEKQDDQTEEIPPDDYVPEVPDYIVSGGAIYDKELGIVVVKDTDAAFETSQEYSYNKDLSYLLLDMEIRTAGEINVFAVDAKDDKNTALISRLSVQPAGRGKYALKMPDNFPMTSFRLRIEFTQGATGKFYGVEFAAKTPADAVPSTDTGTTTSLPLAAAVAVTAALLATGLILLRKRQIFHHSV